MRFDDVPWAASPAPGVERKMLERDGGEVARATSIVRYAPGSAFPEHVHDLGEEFVVLEGIFADEHGTYPAGTYVRNPPGSRHRPFSTDGCMIFVKLRQFDPTDLARVVRPATPGLLHEFGGERVSIVRLEPGGTMGQAGELFVLDGVLDGLGPRWTWLPAAAEVHSETGCTLWLKQRS